MSLYFYFFLFASFICSTLQRECNKDDIGTMISECHSNKGREVIFYWKNECDQSSLQLPQKKISHDCDLTCKPGQFLDFKLLGNTDNNLICSECPPGFYTTGGTKIIKNWSQEILNEFVNNCYIIVNDDIKTNENCEKFHIRTNNGTTSLVAGVNKKNPDAMYSHELIYNVEMEKSGNITFSYRKDTFVDEKYINGQFNFYIDYDLKLHDVQKEGNIALVTHKLEKGSHSLMWQYSVWADPNEKRVKKLYLELLSIEIEGYYNHETGCLPCDKSTQDLPNCNYCPSDSFYYSQENKCVKCNEDEYLFSANSANSLMSDCISKPNCSDDHIVEEYKGKCDLSGVDTISYRYDQDKLCNVPTLRNLQVPQGSATITKMPNNNTSINFTETSTLIPLNHTLLENGILPAQMKQKCEPCPSGYKLFKNNINSFSTCKECPDNTFLDSTGKCLECPKGASTLKVLTISGHSSNPRSLFDTNTCLTDKNSSIIENKACAGWVFRLNGIHSGVKVPNNSQKILTKKIKSNLSSAKLILLFTIFELRDKDEFVIKVNDLEDKYTNISLSKKIYKEYKLQEGYNILSFIYQKDSEATNTEDKFSILIREIIIEGSSEGSAVRCSDCGTDSIRVIKNGKTNCFPCGKGTIPNENKTQCIKCPIGDFSVNCLSCPVFTNKLQDENCNLSQIVHNKKVTLKFDFRELNKQMDIDCEKEICYDSFIGPIKDPKSNNIFFMSYASRNFINVRDFSYRTSQDHLPKGHLFALFDEQYPNINVISNIHENFKILKNIGSYITNVKLIASLKEEENNLIESKNMANIFKHPGVMIEYSNGDYCKGSERYKSYLFLLCDKVSNYRGPRLVKKSEDGCTFYFEMSSYLICPLCTKFQAKPLLSPCIKEKRHVVFQEGETCRIAESKINVDDNLHFEKEISNILSLQDVIENSYLKFFFEIEYGKQYYPNSTFIQIPEQDLQLSDEIIYLTKGDKIIEECSLIETLPYSEYYLIFIVPLIWFVNLFCIIFCYCRYKRIKSTYERLREEREVTSGVNTASMRDNENQLELEVIN